MQVLIIYHWRFFEKPDVRIAEDKLISLSFVHNISETSIYGLSERHE